MGEQDDQPAGPVAVVATSLEVAWRAARDAGLDRDAWFAALELGHVLGRHVGRYVLVVEPGAPARRLNTVDKLVEVLRRRGAVEWTPRAEPGKYLAVLRGLREQVDMAGRVPDAMVGSQRRVADPTDPLWWLWAPNPSAERLYPDVAAFGALEGLDVPSAPPAERFYLDGPPRAAEPADEPGAGQNDTQ